VGVDQCGHVVRAFAKWYRARTWSRLVLQSRQKEECTL
jgi:hypothetical protein